MGIILGGLEWGVLRGFVDFNGILGVQGDLGDLGGILGRFVGIWDEF